MLLVVLHRWCGGWEWWGVVDCNCIVDASIFEFNFVLRISRLVGVWFVIVFCVTASFMVLGF